MNDATVQWRAQVITLFPQAFPGTLALSVIGRALRAGLWHLQIIPLRNFGVGGHCDVDARPAGGGAGLVLRADVVGAAMDYALITADWQSMEWPIIYVSPRGIRFNQKMAYRLSQGAGLTVLCGRFEGIDERILQEYNIVEVSLGDFIITGGEIAAQALIDASVRLIPHVLGNAESAVEESFANGLLEHPHYTKPSCWKGRTIPKVLTGGHHRRIAQWRQARSEDLTRNRRSDLWQAYQDIQTHAYRQQN